MKSEQPRPMKSALFVDFDNIYLGLQQTHPQGAEVFRTEPLRWLSWIEQGMPTLSDYAGYELTARSVLVRQTYLNPAFGQVRTCLGRNGFSVVDCPPVTRQGKNSADIRMTIEIIQYLEHRTHFDEFIILSGDSDFLPVLRHLREHDRRTAIVFASPAVEAYKATADRAISWDLFVEHALGAADGNPSAAGSPVEQPAEILDAIAARLCIEARQRGGLALRAIPAILRQFPEFTRDSNWLGFFSLNALAAALVLRRPDLQIVEHERTAVTQYPGAA